MQTRRAFLAATGTALAAGAGGGALARPARGAEAVDLTERFAGTDGANEVVDATGQSEVTVEVGARGNGGQFAFAPPAVRVDPGTTVIWEWVGSAGPYDVVDPELGYRSEKVDGPGHTFAVEFDGDGLSTDECSEYGDQGMRGVVLVGDGPRDVLSPAGLGGLGTAGAAVAGALGYGLKLNEKTATNGDQ
jgi:halocyanin-like protein